MSAVVGPDFFTYRLRLKCRYWVKIVYVTLTLEPDYRKIIKSAGRTLFFHLSCNLQIPLLGQIQNRIQLKKVGTGLWSCSQTSADFWKVARQCFWLAIIVRSSYDHHKTNHWHIFLAIKLAPMNRNNVTANLSIFKIGTTSSDFKSSKIGSDFKIVR